MSTGDQAYTGGNSALTNIVAAVVVLAGLLAALFLLSGLFTSFHSVGVGQVGIVTAFGKVVDERQSGLTVTWPWPFESVTTMNVQTQKEQEQEDAATKDLQDASTTVALNYHVDPQQVMNLYRRVGADYQNTVILPVLQETLKSTTANYNATDLIDQRPAVVAAMNKQIELGLQPWGIVVDNISIVNFSFSDQFSKAIENKAAAAQSVQTAQYNLQAAQLQAQAQETQKSSLSAQYLQLQAIQKWDGKLPAYLGSGTVFNIPLQGN